MVEARPFLQLPDGNLAREFILSRPEEKFSVRISDFGAVVTAIETPDRDGTIRDVALGFGNPEDYRHNAPGFGAVIGRVANRIAGGRFRLGDKEYRLTCNCPGYALHGGRDPYSERLWQAEVSDPDGVPTLTLCLESPDGDQGFPGALSIQLTYRLEAGRRLVLDYRARTTAPTVVNLTNHTYFNLNGENRGSVVDHVYRIDAVARTVVDAALLPTGEIAGLRGTAYDFSQPAALRERLTQLPAGLDDNFIFGDRHSAEVWSPESGIVLRFRTTEPGVQVYTAYFLDGATTGKDGGRHGRFGGFCLEAQHAPDSPNQPGFPPVVLNPGEWYQQTTEYAFDVK